MIPRSRLSADEANDLDTRALMARLRRAERKAAGLCINGGERSRFGIKHGPPVSQSGRCQRCCDARKARS